MSAFPLEVSVTPEIIAKAIKREIEAGPAYKGASIEGGKGRFYGFLGEEIVHAAMPELKMDNTKDYDFTYKNFTFDVKTKTRKERPEGHYDATVDQSSFHQTPYFYIFVSILAPQNLIKQSAKEIMDFPYTKAWIMGFIPRKMFYEKSRFFNAGDIDPSNKIKYRDSIYLVRYNQLLEIRKLVKALKGNV